MTHLSYKGYSGTIEYSHEDGLFYGRVQGIPSLISYEGKTGPALELDFKESIDAYLAECQLKGVEPEKAFKGSFNVRVAQELHEKAFWLAKSHRVSLNSFVEEAIRERITRQESKSGKKTAGQ